jgi:hypothetical protein
MHRITLNVCINGRHIIPNHSSDGSEAMLVWKVKQSKFHLLLDHRSLETRINWRTDSTVPPDSNYGTVYFLLGRGGEFVQISWQVYPWLQWSLPWWTNYKQSRGLFSLCKLIEFGLIMVIKLTQVSSVR